VQIDPRIIFVTSILSPVLTLDEQNQQCEPESMSASAPILYPYCVEQYLVVLDLLARIHRDCTQGRNVPFN